MDIKRIKQAAVGMAAIVVLVLGAATTSSSAMQGPATPCAQYTPIAGPGVGAPYSPLEGVRQECPLLGPVEKVALLGFGDDFEKPDPCTR